mgnify:CR=1 FL=1
MKSPKRTSISDGNMGRRAQSRCGFEEDRLPEGGGRHQVSSQFRGMTAQGDAHLGLGTSAQAVARRRRLSALRGFRPQVGALSRLFGCQRTRASRSGREQWVILLRPHYRKQQLLPNRQCGNSPMSPPQAEEWRSLLARGSSKRSAGRPSSATRMNRALSALLAFQRRSSDVPV